MRAPATNTHVTRVSRLKTRAPQSGHRTCTPATNTAQTPKTDPTRSRPHARVLATLPPPCRIQRTVVSCVLCADLSLRESIAHPPPLVRPRRRFVCRPRRQLSPNDGLFFPHRPSKKASSSCLLHPSPPPLCVCAHSPCHAIHYQPVARGLQLRPTALLNQK